MSNKRNLGERIKLTSYEEMFGPKDSNVANSTSSRNGEKLENSGVRNIDVTELHSFANHPFKVIDNEEMMELVGSIKENGILVFYTYDFFRNTIKNSSTEKCII